jgi:hypothetical protein
MAILLLYALEARDAAQIGLGGSGSPAGFAARG